MFLDQDEDEDDVDQTRLEALLRGERCHMIRCWQCGADPTGQRILIDRGECGERRYSCRAHLSPEMAEEADHQEKLEDMIQRIEALRKFGEDEVEQEKVETLIQAIKALAARERRPAALADPVEGDGGAMTLIAHADRYRLDIAVNELLDDSPALALRFACGLALLCARQALRGQLK
jgi:hypothetical protein